VHACACIGCARLVPNALLMCVDHWRMVPAALRRSVLARLKELRFDGRSEVAVTEYRQAVTAAVSAVATKQMNKIHVQAGGAGDLFAGGGQ